MTEKPKRKRSSKAKGEKDHGNHGDEESEPKVKVEVDHDDHRDEVGALEIAPDEPIPKDLEELKRQILKTLKEVMPPGRGWVIVSFNLFKEEGSVDQVFVTNMADDLQGLGLIEQFQKRQQILQRTAMQ